jgi:hypothetical protein
MKKTTILLSILALLVILLPGCNLFAPKQTVNAPAETQINYVLSTTDYLKFCNGADMDSEGFRKTITNKQTGIIPEINLSPEQLATKMLVLAAQKANIGWPQSNQENLNYIKVKNQTAYIEPTEGWAGVSIFLCYWKPFVEVNLLQLPEINKVEWVADQQTWQNL